MMIVPGAANGGAKVIYENGIPLTKMRLIFPLVSFSCESLSSRGSGPSHFAELVSHLFRRVRVAIMPRPGDVVR